MIWSYYFLLAVAILRSAASQNLNEAVLEDGASGTAVVLLSVVHIQQAAIFPDDNELLRRIAYVETRDGVSDTTAGGIWAVREEAFTATKSSTNTLLRLKRTQISQSFSIEWRDVEFSDLGKPFYSALAARLVLFLAPRAIPSKTDIVAQAEFWKEHYRNGSLDEFIRTTNELQGAVLDNSASDFYLGFANNLDIGANQFLFVTTKEPDPVPFTVQTLLGFYFTGVARNNETTVVDLGSSYQVFDSSDIRKGIRVSAGNKTIVVYGLNYGRTTSDAYLALPCNRLTVDEYEYYGITYTDGSNRPSQFLLVGCEDNTVITFNGSTKVSLNKMETYIFGLLGENTGSKFVSNKPISFFSGHRCSFVPAGSFACDHLTEQLPPTAVWGTRFLSASFSSRRTGDLYRILTSEPSNNVTVNCVNSTGHTTASHSYTLENPGSWQEFSTPIDSYCAVESNKPMIIVQFGLAHDIDSIGDPFMMMVPPIEQFSNSYVFSVLAEFTTNYITVFVTPANFQPKNIFLDDINLPPIWTAIFCQDGMVCGYAAYASLNPGEHRLYHTDNLAMIGVAAYGFNSYNSYGYPGGLELTPVQLAVISFSQEAYSVLEYKESLKVTVQRSGDTGSHVVVLIANHPYDGTATAGQDYGTVLQVLEFEPGATEKEVDISITNDDSVETNETFILYLSSGAGAYLSPFAEAEITILNDDGTIDLLPNYGNQLGGAPIQVIGSKDLDIKFVEEDNISCVFDHKSVRGVYVNEKTALCVSPQLNRTGKVLFQLKLYRESTLTYGADYYSLPFERAFEVDLQSEEPILQDGGIVDIFWTPSTILPVIKDQESFTIDITLRQQDLHSGEWRQVATLASNLTNNGSAKITIPELEIVDEDIYHPAIIDVEVSSVSMTNSRLRQDKLSKILTKIGQFGLRILKQTPMRIVKKLIRQAAQRIACEVWANTGSSNIGEEINNRLPPCPCTSAVAREPNSGFREEKIVGITLIDDSFRQFFHPNSERCYRQRVTNPSLSGGSGQQCCYDGNGNIVVGQPGGGTVDKVSPDVSHLQHFIQDVVPYLLCCKAGIFSNCGHYYQHRPSDDCSRSLPPPLPAIARGDPHLVTLDGHKYTFNGRGEFSLIETVEDSFTLQGRMVEIENENTSSVLGTVFHAIVAREGKSDTVQFEIVNETLIALVNGELIDFQVVEQEFQNVTLSDEGNNTLLAYFSSGAYIQVKEENGIISAVTISLPESYKNTQIQGLLGNFNDDPSDDLLPRLGQTPLSENSTLQEIHELFGLTWLIDTPGKSLFAYQPEQSWATYFDPFFQPAFKPEFQSPEQEMEAVEICGEDEFCLFDIAATGNVEIGLSTLHTSQQLEEFIELTIPIVCTPECENGACVANDTCACSAGFSGDTCDQKLIEECEENPCENGGTCTKHVSDYLCTCPEGFTGTLCQILCPNLEAPMFGSVSLSGNSQGDIASYSCDDGFLLIGGSIRSCQENGQWTEVPPICNSEGVITGVVVSGSDISVTVQATGAKWILVVMRSASLERWQLSVHGSYGSVTFSDLAPGRYRVRAKARGRDLVSEGTSQWQDVFVL